MTNSKPTTLRHKDIIQEVSEHSGMFIYEIEDALHSLAVVLAQNVAKGVSVSIQGVGTFSLKQSAPRVIKSGLERSKGKEYMSKGLKSCKFKPDSLMKNYLNKDASQEDMFDKESNEGI